VSKHTHKITLVNHTGHTINNIHLSPVEDESWEDDVLDNEHLKRNEHGTIILADEVGEWDLKAIFHNGDEHVWNGLELRAGATLTLKFDKDGSGIAEIS